VGDSPLYTVAERLEALAVARALPTALFSSYVLAAGRRRANPPAAGGAMLVELTINPLGRGTHLLAPKVIG